MPSLLRCLCIVFRSTLNHFPKIRFVQNSQTLLCHFRALPVRFLLSTLLRHLLRPLIKRRSYHLCLAVLCSNLHANGRAHCTHRRRQVSQRNILPQRRRRRPASHHPNHITRLAKHAIPIPRNPAFHHLQTHQSPGQFFRVGHLH